MKVIILDEGSRPNELGYHYTDLNGLLGILADDTLEATNRKSYIDKKYIDQSVLDMPFRDVLRDPEKISHKLQKYLDMKFEDVLDKDVLDLKNLRYLNRDLFLFIDRARDLHTLDILVRHHSWSYARPSKEPTKTVKLTPATVRITLDIDKISNNQKIIPFSYRQKKSRTGGIRSEQEERVIGDTKGIRKYIKAIDFIEDSYNLNTSKYVITGVDHKGRPYLYNNKFGKRHSFNDMDDLVSYLYHASRSGRRVLYSIYDYCNYVLSSGTVNGMGNSKRVSHNISDMRTLLKFINSESKKYGFTVGTFSPRRLNYFLFSSDLLTQVENRGIDLDAFK